MPWCILKPKEKRNRKKGNAHMLVGEIYSQFSTFWINPRQYRFVQYLVTCTTKMRVHSPHTTIHGCKCPSADGGRKETDTALLGSMSPCLALQSREHIEFDSPFSMKSQQQIVKIDSEVWVTCLPSPSHPPLSMRGHRVTRLPPKNASAPWGCAGAWWPAIIIWRVRYIQYLLTCQKLQTSMLYNMAKSDLTWSWVFRRRHLGRPPMAHREVFYSK